MRTRPKGPATPLTTRFSAPCYAGLLRAAGNKAVKTPPPRFDPYYGQLGEVMVRDLKLYEIISQSEGGEDRLFATL